MAPTSGRVDATWAGRHPKLGPGGRHPGGPAAIAGTSGRWMPQGTAAKTRARSTTHAMQPGSHGGRPRGGGEPQGTTLVGYGIGARSQNEARSARRACPARGPRGPKKDQTERTRLDSPGQKGALSTEGKWREGL